VDAGPPSPAAPGKVLGYIWATSLNSALLPHPRVVSQNEALELLRQLVEALQELRELRRLLGT
jgi:hypothetical protein